MGKKAKLYQCPYELACKCDMQDPCLGCETWAEHLDKHEDGIKQVKNEIQDILRMFDRHELDSSGLYNRLKNLSKE